MTPSRYSSEALRDINKRTANKLPPATAVHGMAMYELQRDGEQERLFHAAMFDGSQLRQTSTAQQSKIDCLERAVKTCVGHHDNDRSASLAGVRSLQDGLNSFTTSDSDPKAVLKRSTWLVNELDQEDISTEDQVALTTILATNLTHEAKMELQQAVQHVRDDHLTVIQELLEVKTRVSKLEDLVRVLTAQRNGVQKLPKMAQELEVTTRYGKTVVVKIPKGQALVRLRSSRSQTPTQSNSAADSALNSQSVDENLTVNKSDEFASSQGTAESAAQLADLKAEIMEKPLPPVPSAAEFPGTSSVARSSPVKRTSPLPDFDTWSTPKDDLSFEKPSLNTPSLDADSSVQGAPQTPRALESSTASMPKSKGKSKAKKWTDPPLFHGKQATAAEEPTKTLFSFHDDVEAPNTVHKVSPEQRNNDPKNMSPIRDIPNHGMAQKPLEIKQEPSISLENASSAGFPNLKAAKLQAKQEHPVNGVLNKKRSLGEDSRDLCKQVDENQPPVVKPTQAKPRTAPGEVFSANAIKDIMKSLGPKSSLTITPSEGSASPSAPVVLNVGSDSITSTPSLAPSPAPSPAPSFAPSPAHVDKAPKPTGSGRIAKGCAIKKITESSSSKQTVPTNPSDATPKPQSSTSSVQDRYLHQKAPVTSTASSTAASQVPRVLAPDAAVASPPTFTPNMSANAPTFQPSASFSPSRSTAPGVSTFASSLMAKMTPAEQSRFLEQMNSAV